MLMGEEENGRDIEGFQATLYTQRKINQATQNVRMYNTPPQKGRGPNNKSGQTKLRWNELEKRESRRRRRRRRNITITRRVYLRCLLTRYDNRQWQKGENRRLQASDANDGSAAN